MAAAAKTVSNLYFLSCFLLTFDCFADIITFFQLREKQIILINMYL